MTTPEPSRSTGSDPRHEPVLVAEVVALLRPRADGVYVDGTLGLGGHTAALVDAGAGRVIGIDRDRRALDIARERLGARADRVTFVHGDYRAVRDILRAERCEAVDGVLVDLGVSSLQFDDASRGFSFRAAGPLDMRMDATSGQTLAERLAGVSEAALADVIWRFGEERRSRQVARAIVAARDKGALRTTTELAAVVRRAVGGGWQRIDPATRTFQALRIWVNGELDGLDRFIEDAVSVLRPDGRLAVIAFHSLEDRVVKQTMRRLADEGAVIRTTRRAVQPAEDELQRNPRSRSAKLRAVERAA